MSSRIGLGIFIGFLIIVVIVSAMIAIYFVTRGPIIQSTPFAPQGSIVQLKNTQTGSLLGICTIGTTISCDEGNMTGNYASTSPNVSDPNSTKWTVNVDINSGFVALQNVSTGKYLSNAISPCTHASIQGNLLSVQQDSVSSPTDSASGWFGSFIPSSGSVQLFSINQPTLTTYVGTQTGNAFDNTCDQMVSDGFSQAQFGQTTWIITVVS